MMTGLPYLDQVETTGIKFIEPVKRIHDGPDVQFFLHSLAYRDITSFILQLNRSLVPRKSSDGSIADFRLDQGSEKLPQISAIQQLIQELQRLIDDAPPDTGPRRFGNVSFRKWYQLVDDNSKSLLEKILPEVDKSAIIEIRAYLLGSFGSPQRLDYGTGHELSFIAFIACLWKIGFFKSPGTSSESTDRDAGTERQIVMYLFQPYLTLIRKLIVLYNLEPAGSHGVWGLDDNSFLPYLFGSAQLCPAISDHDTDSPTPILGSLDSAPDPSIVTKQNLVEKEAKSNLYFGAIYFIYNVKKGPFWEHSPMLFDISGIKDGWGKINKGLIKMYDAEVLGKFPVVQHFPFGSLLRWENDPRARPQQQSTHTTNQPLRNPAITGGASASIRPQQVTAPWASASTARPPPTGFVNGVTQAPWAKAGNAPRMAPPSQFHGAGARPTGSRPGQLRPVRGPAMNTKSTAVVEEAPKSLDKEEDT